jgi:hypothetical protein
MDDFLFAMVDLRLTIEHAAANVLDQSLGKVRFRLVHCQTDKVAISEADLKVVAASSADLLCCYGFAAGERPKTRRDGTLI